MHAGARACFTFRFPRPSTYLAIDLFSIFSIVNVMDDDGNIGMMSFAM